MSAKETALLVLTMVMLVIGLTVTGCGPRVVHTIQPVAVPEQPVAVPEEDPADG